MKMLSDLWKAKEKRKNLDTSEIRDYIEDVIEAKNAVLMEQAEKLADRIMRKLHDGKFKPISSDRVSISVWVRYFLIDDSHPPYWYELKKVLSNRGFENIDDEINILPFHFTIKFSLPRENIS